MSDAYSCDFVWLYLRMAVWAFDWRYGTAFEEFDAWYATDFSNRSGYGVRACDIRCDLGHIVSSFAKEKTIYLRGIAYSNDCGQACVGGL